MQAKITEAWAEWRIVVLYGDIYASHTYLNPKYGLQAKISDAWAVRPADEESRAMCDCQLLQRDFSLLTTVHSEATKQVICSEFACKVSQRDRPPQHCAQ